MAAISSLVVNDVMPSKDHTEDVDTPTTPRAFRFPATSDIPSNIPPLPQTNLTQQSAQAISSLSNQSLHQGNSPSKANSLILQEDTNDVMDIDDSDPEGGDSDNDDEAGDGDAASRKKKGQRFFCTGYPPCNLSFTRSEHLARHIRKHTGERPFQCHCNRRFSRLDNLRQHAQTVHVNEEIPTDSLAATGTRFQRQIRTDRMRQNGRPRSGTVGSTGSQSRGHSRNLSASSVGSTSSNYSTVTEAKRRPPPLLMANENTSRPKLGLDLPSTPPSQYRGFGPHSPGGMATPTSATFSAAPGSPGYGSSMGSPAPNVVRGGYYAQSPRTPGRRLSVPSGPNPFQGQYSNIYPAPYSGQVGSAGPTNSSNSSLFSSPVSTTFSTSQSQHIPPSEDWRRRTWHPSTFTGPNFNYGRPATSSLTYSQTPDAPQPAYAQHATAAAGQAPRLPGIESFDHIQRPSTPPRRQHSPLRMDSRPPQLFAPNLPGPRPSTYPELDEHGHVAKSSSWSQQAINEIRKVGTNHQDPFRPMEMGPPAAALNMPQQQHQRMAQEALQIQSAEKRNRRQGWYNGPPHGARTSPEDSSSSEGVPTPGTSAIDVHPIIMHSNGYPEPHHALIPPESQQNACLVHPNPMTAPYGNTTARQRTVSFSERSTGSGEMNRLEALVAVATSGDNVPMRSH